ncbi:hypothetical protein JXB12_11350 [candidate division KSB1 bacterium]|nr:hypothetical protein [candidate division KSB1 bacterium]
MTEGELNEILELFSHKLKNPIHAVGINIDVLQMRLKKQSITDNAIYKHLDIVRHETDRVQEIVMRFINYLSKTESQRKKIDVRKFLEVK